MSIFDYLNNLFWKSYDVLFGEILERIGYYLPYILISINIITYLAILVIMLLNPLIGDSIGERFTWVMYWVYAKLFFRGIIFLI